MKEFRVPEDFGDLSALQTPTEDRFRVSPDLLDLRPLCDHGGVPQLNDHLDAVASRLGVERGHGDVEDVAALAVQENFDDMFAFVSVFKRLPSKIKQRVLHILDQLMRRIITALGGNEREDAAFGRGSRNCHRDAAIGEDGETAAPQGQARLELRNAFQMTVYLLFSAAYPAEEVYSSSKQNAGLDRPTRGTGSRGGAKSSLSGGFEWEQAREAILMDMRLALTVDPSRVWRQGVPDRTFMGLFLRLSCKMLEVAETVNTLGGVAFVTVGQAALDLISGPFLMAQGMEPEVSAAAFQLVRGYKHLASPIAKLCRQLVEKYGDSRLGAELLRDIGRMEMPDISSKNTGAISPVVYVSDFLRELVMLLPGTVHAHVSIILPHLSSRPYQIRNAVVFSLAEVLAAAHENELEAKAGGMSEVLAQKRGEGGEGGSQADPRRVTLNAKNRDALFDQLKERALDVSPFVRSTVIKAWAVIAEREALPRMRFLIAARVGTDRLRDQSSLVRKEAVRLMATLLAHNPYNMTLDRESNQQLLDKAESELRAMSPPAPILSPPPPMENHESDSKESRAYDGNDSENDRDDPSVSRDEAGSESDDGEREDETRQEAGEGQQTEEHGDTTPEEEEESPKEVSARDAKFAECEHLVAAMLFIKELETATERLGGMLGSKTTTDVVEALRFFVTACHFQLPGAIDAIKKSFMLIWRTEGTIVADIKKAFVEVFIRPASEDDSGSTAGLPAQQVARNLVKLVNESKPGELASLEEVVATLVKDWSNPKNKEPNYLDPEVFEQLWCAVNSRGQNPKGRAGALHAIAMGASADPSLVSSAERLGTIREAALGKGTMDKRDWRTVQCACFALLRCDPNVMRNGREADLIMSRLSYFLQGMWCMKVTSGCNEEDRTAAEGEMKDWFAAAEQAVAVLFHFSSKPEALSAAVIRRMASETLASDVASPLALARLCFVLGHVALKLLVYSEDLAGSLERARAKTKPPPKEKGGGNEEDDEDDATAQELGLNAEASAEDEARLTELVDKEIVGRNLLGAFGPLLVRIVANEGASFGHPLIRQSAVLALCKFMCISGAFCERQLSLLFTTLERETDTAVRANIVVALGDLAFRFPNALEPWNKKIYERLRDRCPRVRANAIMVLTHLILNDMVKVKGQVSELAVCMVDPEPKIQDAAKVFFHKYSERGTNPVYNVLPDIVGRLSADTSLKPAEFREIIDFLMQYVKKDKLTEQLAEKLVARLAASAGEGALQSRNVAYCLGQLRVTEKAVARLAELVPTYKDLLQDKEVYENFAGLVSRAKKFATVEMQQAIGEWEKTLKEFHEGGAEDEDAAARATQAGRTRRGSKRSSSTSARRGYSTGDDAGSTDTAAAKALARASRSGKTKKPEVDSSSEEEAQEDDDDIESSDDEAGTDEDQIGDVDTGEDDESIHDDGEEDEEIRYRGRSRRSNSPSTSTKITSKKCKANTASVASKLADTDDEEELWESDEEVFEPEPEPKTKPKKVRDGLTKENRASEAREGGKGGGGAKDSGGGSSRSRRVFNPLN